MVIESLEIETKSNYHWDDIVYIYDIDAKLIKVIKRESRIGLIFIILYSIIYSIFIVYSKIIV